MKRISSLESLDEAKQEWIAEMGKVTRFIDLATILKEEGIETSPASLSRFIRIRAEKRLIAEGEEMKGAVETLANRNGGENLRKGTLEAARQKLYEQVVNSADPETARVAYEAMLKEETKLKELELEARKAAALEEGVKLQRLRIEIQARARSDGQRRMITVESEPAAGELPGPVEREFVEGKEKILTEGNSTVAGQGRESGGGLETGANPDQIGTGSVNGEGKEREELAKLAEFFRRMGEILNRGGRPEEKLLEARAIWEESEEFLKGI